MSPIADEMSFMIPFSKCHIVNNNNHCNCISSKASKPINNRWIRTDNTENLSIAVYYRQSKYTQIKIIELVPVILA